MDKIFIGADIGGTTVKLGVFSEHLIEKWEIPTRTVSKGKYILQDIWESICDKTASLDISADQISAIGLAVPGPVLGETVVNRCVNLGWGTTNIRREMKKYCDVPVIVGNDANTAALGELWHGAGKSYTSIVMVTLGTGVGGGVVVNNKIVSGSSGSAGEIGHLCVEPTEETACGCGLHGCLEQFASATGIVRLANRALNSTDENSILRNIENFTAKDVLDGAKGGDPVACRVFDQVCDYLGRALATVAVVVDPDAFIIGGGVSKAGDFLINGIEKKYRNYAFHAASMINFKLAALGNDAGIYGAAKMAKDMIAK